MGLLGGQKGTSNSNNNQKFANQLFYIIKLKLTDPLSLYDPEIPNEQYVTYVSNKPFDGVVKLDGSASSGATYYNKPSNWEECGPLVRIFGFNDPEDLPKILLAETMMRIECGNDFANLLNSIMDADNDVVTKAFSSNDISENTKTKLINALHECIPAEELHALFNISLSRICAEGVKLTSAEKKAFSETFVPYLQSASSLADLVGRYRLIFLKYPALRKHKHIIFDKVTNYPISNAHGLLLNAIMDSIEKNFKAFKSSPSRNDAFMQSQLHKDLLAYCSKPVAGRFFIG